MVALSKERTGKITGSIAGAALGLSPFQTKKEAMRSLVRAWHGAEPEFKGNHATEYGHKFEAMALEDFRIETGLDAKANTEFFKASSWLGATPDALTDDAVVEIKCPFSKRESKEFEEIPPHYYAQVQIEMLSTLREKCYFYQWSPQGSRIDVIRIDSEWLIKNIPLLLDFHNKFLIELSNPAHLEPLVKIISNEEAAQAYKETKAALDEAKAAHEAAKEALINIADGNKSEISGVLVYPIERKPSISYSKAVKDLLPNADLTKYQSGESKITWGVKCIS